jgi:hypothetical protein
MSGKEWDRPIGSLAPNRMGDRSVDPLFLALGKAVSAWEGVQAATSSLYFALRIGSSATEDDPGFGAFAGLTLVHKRRNELEERSRAFLGQDFGAKADAARTFQSDLSRTLYAYVGWAERRNDIAHGYVTEAQTPDHHDPEQRILTVYALCPSYARLRKWQHGEPKYNYLAADLELFADRFHTLDGQLETLENTADFLSGRKRD